MHNLLRLKLTEALTAPVPVFTPRQVRLPAVIGVRRSGKTPLETLGSAESGRGEGASESATDSGDS
ncbi:MAG: hypothetical protein V3U32_08275 [Anaerolineales bacterium]